MNDTILETVNLTREFSGFVAVDDVSLTVREGTIHALIAVSYTHLTLPTTERV